MQIPCALRGAADGAGDLEQVAEAAYIRTRSLRQRIRQPGMCREFTKHALAAYLPHTN